MVQIPRHLHVQPRLRGEPEEALQTKRGVRRDTATPLDDRIEAHKRNAELLRRVCLRESQFFQELVEQDFTRVRGRLMRRDENHLSASLIRVSRLQRKLER